MRRKPSHASAAAAEPEGVFRPQLTSLVYVMAILLAFLIRSFSAEGYIVTPADDLQLPLSVSQDKPRKTCTLEISAGNVAAEGTVLADITSFAKAESLTVPGVYQWMKAQRGHYADSAEVMIQADRDVEFNIVKRIMFTCSKAGFDQFSVLVVQDE